MGNFGDDKIFGGDGADIIWGDDNVEAHTTDGTSISAFATTIDGRNQNMGLMTGKDKLYGGKGDDLIYGGHLADEIHGGEDDD